MFETVAVLGASAVAALLAVWSVARLIRRGVNAQMCNGLLQKLIAADQSGRCTRLLEAAKGLSYMDAVGAVFERLETIPSETSEAQTRALLEQAFASAYDDGIAAARLPRGLLVVQLAGGVLPLAYCLAVPTPIGLWVYGLAAVTAVGTVWMLWLGARLAAVDARTAAPVIDGLLAARRADPEPSSG